MPHRSRTSSLGTQEGADEDTNESTMEEMKASKSLDPFCEWIIFFKKSDVIFLVIDKF